MKYRIINELTFIDYSLPYNEAVRWTNKIMGIPNEASEFIQNKAEQTIEISIEPTKEIIDQLSITGERTFKEVLKKSNIEFVSLKYIRVELII